MRTALILLLAVLLDQLIGEPRSLHPLVGFGNVATFFERHFNQQTSAANAWLGARLPGLVAVVVLIAPVVLIVALFTDHGLVTKLLDVVILYLALGAKSLREHAQSVAIAVNQNDLVIARKRVSLIVSRDTDQLDMMGVQKAAIESVLENGSDAIFGAIFYYVVGGAPAVVLYRLANTLDAMWGYKNQRYLHFGWAAARLDDILNWIPARLTAATYAVLGNAKIAIHCWNTQAPTWYSPNAGPVMAAGAGALELKLGGTASYHGQTKLRPELGEGRAPTYGDIERSIDLVTKGIRFWLALVFLAAVIFHA